jgi:hypothetical protein
MMNDTHIIPVVVGDAQKYKLQATCC